MWNLLNYKSVLDNLYLVHLNLKICCGKNCKISIFKMIKEALVKATIPITFMVMFLIIGLAPLYVIYGIIDKNIPVKTK